MRLFGGRHAARQPYCDPGRRPDGGGVPAGFAGFWFQGPPPTGVMPLCPGMDPIWLAGVPFGAPVATFGFGSGFTFAGSKINSHSLYAERSLYTITPSPSPWLAMPAIPPPTICPAV